MGQIKTKKGEFKELIDKYKEKKGSKVKKNSKTSLLVELCREKRYTLKELIEKTHFTKSAIYSIIYWHLKKRGVVIKSENGKYCLVEYGKEVGNDKADKGSH